MRKELVNIPQLLNGCMLLFFVVSESFLGLAADLLCGFEPTEELEVFPGHLSLAPPICIAHPV